MAGKPSAFWLAHRSKLEELVKQGYTDREIFLSGEIPVDKPSKITLARQRWGIPAGETYRTGHAAHKKPFRVESLPATGADAAELLARRKSAFSRVAEAKKARKLIRVDIDLDGPFGVAHFGDPHVDDDGTDLALLERHLGVVNRTEGLFAGNVGDYSNNWIGRLAQLWAQQSTSASEGWTLVEWLLKSCDWLYLVGGNHDAWSGEGDPLKWIAAQQGALLEPHGVRLELVTPASRSFRVNARHDFRGHSQWNTAHGVAKAAQMGWRDHVLTCGHTHTSGYQMLKDPSSGLISHAVRVASYKTYDRYAEEKGLPDQAVFNCPVTIFDPAFADDDVRAVTFLPDPEEAAEYLTWKRQRWAQGRMAA